MGCGDSKEAIQGSTANPANQGTTREDNQALHLAARKGAKRNNVINQTDLNDSFTAPVYAKTAEQEEVIRLCITSSEAFFFTDIEEREIAMLVNAMQVREVDADKEVITQGDPGDYFYVVSSGKYRAFVNGKLVKDYSAGMFFGELALAYNKPRAASVSATTKGTLFALEASVFRRVIAQASKGRYDSVLAALQKVDLLWNASSPANSNLTEEQLGKIAECVEVSKFSAGDQIIRKGSMGKLFYMIKEGHVVVKNKGVGGAGEALADTNLGPGTYVGELALMRDVPRAADVLAKTDCILLCLDRDTFMNILGPLQEVIDHNANMRLLDSVTLFQLLTKKEKRAVYDNFEPEFFAKGEKIIEEGTVGSKFFIMKEGEARVMQGGKPVTDKATGKVVKRFKGQHFGEMALMADDPRSATIEATSNCEVLTLDRKQFCKLVAIKDVHEKLAQMNESYKSSSVNSGSTNLKFSELKELAVLGSGTFGRVTLVQAKGPKDTKNHYALKAMLKSEIVMHKQQDNVINEKNAMLGCNHPFILKLYQTFKDSQKLYMLLEFVQGGELFSVLHPAHPVNGMDGVNNKQAMFYAAGVLLGIAYLHNERNIAYRDMKPENCLIDAKGYVPPCLSASLLSLCLSLYLLCSLRAH